MSTSLLTTVYYSMIDPYLSYEIMLWSPSACKPHLHKIEVLQQKIHSKSTQDQVE